MSKTVQLRRYHLIPELADDFLVWWPTLLVPAREAAGFTIEFATYVPESREFVWAVSVPGDEAAFRAVDQAWISSPERAAIFVEHSTWTAQAQVDFVQVYR